MPTAAPIATFNGGRGEAGAAGGLALLITVSFIRVVDVCAVAVVTRAPATEFASSAARPAVSDDPVISMTGESGDPAARTLRRSSAAETPLSAVTAALITPACGTMRV
jgi:hypothetical protein